MAVDSGTSQVNLPTRERNVLLLDLSKSMLAPLPDTAGQPERQKIEVARTAVFRILQDATTSGALFGLVTFTETVRVAVPLTDIHRENLPVHREPDLAAHSERPFGDLGRARGRGRPPAITGTLGVQGNLVLVTDGWDNASTRFDVQVHGAGPASSAPRRIDLVPYLLPPESDLTLQVIGIGSGAETGQGGRLGPDELRSI